MTSANNIENLCIYGVGGVGGYFGGKILSSALKNQNGFPKTYFIARGEHLNAIRRSGLSLVTPSATFTGKPTVATDDVESIPCPDLILLCVKSYGLDEAMNALKKKVKENTVIIPLLNGVDIYERIRTHINVGILFPACVFVGTHIDSPGIIRQNGGNGRILFGRDPQHPEFIPESSIDFFKKAEIDFSWMDDPYPAIWGKFIFIAAFGLVTARSGCTLGELMKDDAQVRSVLEVMGEIKVIAQAKGILLPENIIGESLAKANNFPPETKTSYQRDIESGGGKNEGDLFGGTIIRLGEELSVPTPVTKTIYSDIHRRFP
ncbi:MAG: 2-dehydropantoate 2-reductase [Nitrospinota bacterium]|nr:2-dehydropantoate 2-reductase [Nitrospinota bacterium]